MKLIASPSTRNGFQKPTHEQIASAAFHLYFENGCRNGHDLDDWLRAEGLLTHKAKEVWKDQVSDPKQKAVNRRLEVYPVKPRQLLSLCDE
jgi:hypothetical protein